MNEPAIGERESVRAFLGRLRAQRLARNWSQAELARRAGISRASYQNFETGYGNLTIVNLVRILGVLDYVKRLPDLIPEVQESRTLETMVKQLRPRVRARKKGRT